MELQLQFQLLIFCVFVKKYPVDENTNDLTKSDEISSIVMISSLCILPLGLAAVSGQCDAGYYCGDGASRADPTDGVTGNLCPPGRYCGE